MKIPSRDMQLVGGLHCASREIEHGVWLEHIVKHTLGAAYPLQGREWNLEGWDKLNPTVVSELERKQIFGSIAELGTETQPCKLLARGQGKSQDAEHLPCYVCKPTLVLRCGEILNCDVGFRYAAIIERLLEASELDSAVSVKRSDFRAALFQNWCNPERYEGLHVLSFGLDGASGSFPIIRISRWDGVRAEFYFEQPNRLRWRTTFRSPAMLTGPQRISFLASLARRATGPMSDLCVVTRHWWETK